jgi:hypothetical protein
VALGFSRGGFVGRLAVATHDLCGAMSIPNEHHALAYEHPHVSDLHHRHMH